MPGNVDVAAVHHHATWGHNIAHAPRQIDVAGYDGGLPQRDIACAGS